MITEQQVTLRKQTAENDNWLYQDDLQGNRTFAKNVYLGINAKPWAECTNDEKLAWEEAHKPEGPQIEDVEPEEANS